MNMPRATCPLLVFPLLVAGCSTAPDAVDPGGAPCDGAASCHDEAPPEAFCLERLAADVLEDGCGVFVAGVFGSGDDANPGTREKPLRTLQRGIELARTGRGRVFACYDGFFGPITLPSGVDLLGGYDCINGWVRLAGVRTIVQHDEVSRRHEFVLTVEPASAGDSGAADGISTIADVDFFAQSPIAIMVRSDTAVDLTRSWIRSYYGIGGELGEEWPGLNRAPDGAHGKYGGDACSAETVAGGPAIVNPCDGGLPSVSGKGGDGLPGGAEDGGDGAPRPMSAPAYSGGGGAGDPPGTGCHNGHFGSYGTPGTAGAAGKGIGHITETGWEGDRGGDGTRGMPGQGGGGGGGRRGGLSGCGVASRGGAGGGSGGAGGCGGRGGRGGGNGHPSIGIVALHARLAVRDITIETNDAGPGGDGGRPEQGGRPGRGAPGGAVGDGTYGCEGGNGGDGGDGGYGGPGRGADSIGIAYLDEDQLTVEGVTFLLGPPGKGGISWDREGNMFSGEDGAAVETLRFPE
ncbi:hypothetical protein [Sorangium sp. So ce861]|uniref:hypothetical protein n=1 Tax=Sorangium sp. So ce861 TaxID=3133323 RepID=UPI003F5F82B1